MLSLKAGREFGDLIKQQIAGLAGLQTVAARLTVPYDLRWWYWLEYGTASRAMDGKGSGHSYKIVPINAAHLRFPDPTQQYDPNKDGFAVMEMVLHPGIHPRRFVHKAMPFITEAAAIELRAFVATTGGRFTAEQLKELMHTMMKNSLAHITASLAAEAPGRRTEDGWGRLHGASAAEVFGSNHSIEDTSR